MTKIALAIGFIVYCKLGYFSPVVAFILALLSIAISFVIDSKRQATGSTTHAVYPSYGMIVLVVNMLVLTLMWLGNSFIGYTMLTPLETVAAAYLGASVLSLIFLSSEGSSNMLWNFIFGSGGQQTRFQQPATSFVPPPNWRYQCPRCFARVQHAIDICWNCNYGADSDNPVATDTPPKPTAKRIPVKPRD